MDVISFYLLLSIFAVIGIGGFVVAFSDIFWIRKTRKEMIELLENASREPLRIRARQNRHRCVEVIDTLRGTRELLKRAEQRIERLEASEQATKEAEKVARDELKRLRDDLYHLLNPDAPRVTAEVSYGNAYGGSGGASNVCVKTPKLNGTYKYPVVELPEYVGQEKTEQDWRERFPIGSKWITDPENLTVVTVERHDLSKNQPLICSSPFGEMSYTKEGLQPNFPDWNIIGPADEVEAPAHE